MNPPGDSCVIVDTNVLCVAEGLHEQASDNCVAACVAVARRIEQGLTIAVDETDLILLEYVGALKHAHTARIGAKLAAYLYQRRHQANTCRRVPVTPIDTPAGSFAEVPEPLRDFDLDDQKFIAVAVAEGNRLPILTAVDREWWGRHHEFTENGVNVQFLCLGDLLAGAQ
jgi:hypothetical protein